MTFRTSLALLLTLPLLAGSCAAAINETCDSKAQAIEQQLAQARQQGQTERVSGLMKALTQVKANCTAQTLEADKQRKVREYEQEVAERQQDLREAQASGDKDKIAVRQKKLEEAIAELRATGE